MSIKNIRNILIILTSLIIFIGAQVVPSTSTKEIASFVGALFMALLAVVLQGVMWSDYMYNQLRDNGAKIQYKTYQRVGILIVVFFLILVTTAYYQGFMKLR